MDLMGRLLVKTYCDSCGFVESVPFNDTVNRCTQCGKFATNNPDVCCAQHELKESPYPSGECPACEQERHRRDMIQHEMTRDPQVEPW